MKLKFSPVSFLAPYDSGLGGNICRVWNFLVNVVRLLLLRFLQLSVTATRDKLFGKIACRIMC